MSLYEIYFSPTGGTKKVASILSNVWNCDVKEVDLLKNEPAAGLVTFTAEDICIVAVPSYGGRVPSVAVDRLKEMKGNGAKAILTVVYGNSHIDDTMMELSDVLTECGFTCVAGIEAVAEHSLMHQFGAGRPDASDKAELEEFAGQIKEMLEKGEVNPKLDIPGKHEYREYNGVPLKPAANGKCISCGLCAKECPVNAIPTENPKITDKEKCISCMHCAAVCPKNARKLSKLMVFVASQKMKKGCSDRKENKLYI